MEGVSRMSMGEDKSQVSGPLKRYVERSHKGARKTPLVVGWGGCAFLGAGQRAFQGRR